MSETRAAEDRRLATLHLRLGSLALARAELEDLGRQAALEAPGLADLAEARWRSGDLEAAATAALEHIAAGGARPIAHVIAAEAAAAAGRPVEARAHVDALGPVDAEALEQLFAGMPRRAFWPSAPSAPIGPAATMFEADRFQADRTGPAGRRSPLPGAAQAGAATAPGAESSLAPSIPAPPPVSSESGGMTGFWGDDEPSPVEPRGAGARRRPASPAEELARARRELDAAGAVGHDLGLARLALVLRQDPGLASDVLAALGPRRDAAAQLVRGDACRLLGRQLEAEAAFAAAARELDEPRPAHEPGQAREPGPAHEAGPRRQTRPS
ncbi:MAG: hypothetical protein AB1736_07450 [Chloroflexota bacterium]